MTEPTNENDHLIFVDPRKYELVTETAAKYAVPLIVDRIQGTYQTFYQAFCTFFHVCVILSQNLS